MTHHLLTATPFTTTEEGYNDTPTNTYSDLPTQEEMQQNTDALFSTIFNIIAAVVIFCVAFIVACLVIHAIRSAINPAYREKMNKETAEYIEERKLRKQQKAQERAFRKRQRQRALDSMSTTERLLYEQNKELRRIHWYLTLRDLFAPRRRR